MGQAGKRGTFEQRKAMSENSKAPKQIDMNEAAKMLADAINGIIMAGVPIPFVIATMDLIHHDLCAQHIAMTNRMQQIASGKAPMPEMPKRNEAAPPSDN